MIQLFLYKVKIYFLLVLGDIMKEKNMITAKRMKQCRLSADETLEQIGQLVGVHKTTVRRWETGETERIALPTIQRLAIHYNVSPAWLMGADVPMQIADEQKIDYSEIDNIVPLPKTKKVPLLGTIACGEPILAEENIEDYVNMPETIKGTFALRCKGDSMINARILDGDIVYIKEQQQVENGEIAAILIDNEATLKRVYYYPEKNMLILKAENPKYDDFIYSNEELNNIRILGKAVGFYSRVV